MAGGFAGFVTRHLSALFVLLLLGLFAYVAWASTGFPIGARLFPHYMAIAGIVLALAELLRHLLTRGAREAADFSDLPGEGEGEVGGSAAKALLLFAWIAGFYLLIWLFGLMPAIGLFVLAFLVIQFRTGWIPALAIAASLLIFVAVLSRVLVLRWPQGIVAGLF